jgi:hypothetical protein
MINNSSGSSYNILINRLEAFANGHLMINQFSHGSIDLIDVPKDNRYPVMHVAPGSISPNNGVLQYAFDILFFDCPRSKEEKADYQREVISDMARLALDLISEIQNGNVLFGKDVYLVESPSIEPFVEEYSQVVTGVTLSLVLEVSYNWSACDIPADWSVGGSNTGGNGSAVGITLKVNNTDNAVQNVLNLVNGNNVTITDLGAGNVRIAATGGGGGGADWGAIGGDIEDQADLIALLLDYTPKVDFTNEVLTLQANIDSVANDLAIETTAREDGDAQNAFDTAAVSARLSAHEANTFNPHATTKAQVGLGNVPNVDTTTTANITDAANKRFVTDANLTTIGNQSGTNTGDETTATIQAKRPIKTVNGGSLEGSGDLSITSYHALRATSTSFTLTASSGDRFVGLTSFLNSGTENPTQIAAEYPMVFTKLVIRTTNTQNAGGSMVFTLRKNGVDTAIVCTIPAGATTNIFTATGSVSFAASDLISIKARNNAAATSANVVQMSIMYTTI